MIFFFPANLRLALFTVAQEIGVKKKVGVHTKDIEDTTQQQVLNNSLLFIKIDFRFKCHLVLQHF